MTRLQAPAHGGKECYGDALEARKCFLRECRNGNGEKEGGEDEDEDDDEIAVRGDPFITFAERGRGGGYPKENVVSEVA